MDDDNLWYNDINAVGRVGGQLKAFLEFGKATVSHRNTDKDNFCFLVNVGELEADQGSNFLEISYYYRKAHHHSIIGHGSGFVPPGTPPKPVCKYWELKYLLFGTKISYIGS